MNLPKYWPVAVLFVAALFYFWIDEDEPLPNKQSQQENTAEKHRMTGSYRAIAPSASSGGQPGYQTPAYTPGQYPSVYTQPGQTGPYQAPYTGNYQFRNEAPIDNTRKRVPDPYGRPQQNQDYPYARPVPQFQDYAGPGATPVPDESMTYRFRPQEGKRQSKRWQGNYARKPKPHYQPQRQFPYNNQPPSTNQGGSAAERKPLWANSWRER